MSDAYSTPTGDVTVNVAAPQPAAATIPTASETQVDAFLGASTPATPHGGAPRTPGTSAEPEFGGIHSRFVAGALKGFSQQALGALSLIPGLGNYFTRESTLGKLAYARSTTGSESIGNVVGTIAPWIVGGQVLGGARAVSALSKLGRPLARVLSSAERVPGTRPVTGSMAPWLAGGEVEVGSAGGGIARLKPSLARGATAGAIAGAAQEPEGDPSYLGRVAPALGGAAFGGLLGQLGVKLSRGQTAEVEKLAHGLAGLMTAGEGAVAGAAVGSATGVGAMLGGGIGGLGALAIAYMSLHSMGFNVALANKLAPAIAEYAAKLAQNTVTSTTGALSGKTVNEIGERL